MVREGTVTHNRIRTGRNAAGTMTFLVTLAFAAGWGPGALAQQNFDKVEIKSTRVAGPVYMLEGAGGNIGVSAGEDGTLIVDDQFAPLAEKIEAALQKLATGKVRYVLNTHWHGDHTGGNEHFGGSGATIVAHANVRSRLSSDQEVKLFGQKYPPRPKEALPVITFQESLSVHFNGEEIKVIHLAKGHTDGDSVVFFTKSNVVHTGDQFFNGIYPFIDLDSGGNVQGYINNVAMLIKLIPADAKIIPGHGPLANIEDLKRFHKMLLATSDMVQSKIKEGKTLEEIKQEGIPAEIDSVWGKGLIKADAWLGIVFESYK